MSKRLLDAPRPPVSAAELAFVGTLLLGILASRFHSYILFHVLIELFGVVVYFSAFSLAWNTRRHLEDPLIRFAGLAIGPTVVASLLHTIAYKEMGVFPPDANLPTQLWIALRVLQASAMFLATVPTLSLLPAERIVCCFSLATGALLALIFSGLFPDCYAEGYGLTPFKVITEYGVMAIFIAAAIRLWRDPSPRDPIVRKLGALMLFLGALQSAAFTLYIDVYGALNMAGHILGFVCALMVYAAIAWRGLAIPQAVLYAKLEAQKESYATDAERSHADIVRFSEILAHHLQEPARQQFIFSQMLVRSMPNALSDESKQALKLVMNGALRLKTLLRDAESYLSYAQLPQVVTPSDANQALDVALGRLQSKITESSAIIQKCSLTPLLIPSGPLSDLFTVLLDNAIEHGRPGVPPVISISVFCRHDENEVVLSDNGVGIPKEFCERVFRVFERLGPPKSEAGGSGIGLAMAKRIVEACGGSIWIKPAESGHGTDVHFTVPTDRTREIPS